MLKVGQKTKTKSGFPVEIIAVLDVPDHDGYAIVGIKTLDGQREITTWRPNGRYLANKSCGSDLVMEPLIETRCVCPPIPDRRFDWCAWYADRDEGGPVGWGPNKDEAIADLKDSYPREQEAA
jgi:hypothetical protein